MKRLLVILVVLGFSATGFGRGRFAPPTKPRVIVRVAPESSDWIIHVLEAPDERPVWVTVWGGPNTLAQALWKIRQTKLPEEAERLYKKLRVRLGRPIRM